VAQMLYSRVYRDIRLSRREQLMLLEIGEDLIDTASGFVDYMREAYGFSKSSIWYCLNRLKEFGLVEFANREELGKPLRLTKQGLGELTRLDGSKNELIAHFSNSFMESMEERSSAAYAESCLSRGIYAYR